MLRGPTTRLRYSFAHRRGALQAILGTVCAVLVASGSFWSSSSPAAPRTVERTQRPTRVPGTSFQSLFQHNPRLQLTRSVFPSIAETESRPGIEEDTEGRSDWFTFQRTYPSNAIPPDARLRAWQARPGYQLDSVVGPQAEDPTIQCCPRGPRSLPLRFWAFS